MISNPFGVEVGECYKYHRPGWECASIVKIEENAKDVYGMQVRPIEYRRAYELFPVKLSDYPADGIFEIIRLKLNSRVSSPVTVAGAVCKTVGFVPSRFKS